jgi:hypothetical protein
MAGAPPIQVEGLKQFRAELKNLGPEWSRMLAKANKQVAELVVPEAQTATRSVHINAMSGRPSGKVQAKVASTIRAATSSVEASVKVGKGMPFVFGALLGALPIAGRAGSKRRATYEATGKGGVMRQFPVHIGNSWVVGEPGGPYGIGDAFVHAMPAIREAYDAALAEVVSKAFPD